MDSARTRSARMRALGIALGSLIAFAGPARAIPLDALEGTSQAIGDLTFSFTNVEEVGGIDLGQIELLLVSDADGTGFDLVPASGALSVTAGAIRDLKLEFTVASTLGVVEAGNFLTATASGGVSSASVSELLLEAPAVDLGVFVATFGALPENVQTLGATLFTLTATKNLVIAADGPTGAAEISRLRQRFAVVPEPATAGFLGMGLAGLAWLGRRRG